MPATPTTFTQARAQLDQLIADVSSEEAKFNRSVETISGVATALSALNSASPGGYQGLNNYIASEAANNSENPAWTTMNAERLLVIANFMALNTTVDDTETAIAGVGDE